MYNGMSIAHTRARFFGEIEKVANAEALARCDEIAYGISDV